jgi:putative ABC transport system ATP-binding protein
MDTPTLGEIYFGKENIAKYSQDKLAIFRRENCGFVFQQIYLIESMSVLDNVIVAGLLLPVDKKVVVQKAKRLLKSVGLEENLWHKLPGQLSGGEAQRVGVARASINSPKIVFADEPTGALNSIMARAVLDVLTESNKSGQIIVMVTHDINSALRGNRILYLKDGVVEAELRLDKFDGENAERRAKMKDFLSIQGW